MKVNLSRIYMLPLLDEYIGFESKYIGYVKNTFIKNSEIDEPTISILHKFNYKDVNFPAYEKKLTECPLFIKSIDKGENVIYIFKIPEKYLNEYNLFQDSIYSKFNESYKEIILSFWLKMYRSRPIIHQLLANVRQILYKSDVYRLKLQKDLNVSISPTQELGEYVDLEKELLTV